MKTGLYRFEFDPSVPLAEAERTLHVALFATEGLVGPARVRLEVGYELETKQNSLVIDATTAAGADVLRVFTGLLIREFGESAFHVQWLACEGPLVSAATARAEGAAG